VLATVLVALFEGLTLLWIVAVTSNLGILGLFAAALVVIGFRQTLALLRSLEAERARTAGLADEVRALDEVA
jgi:hypothetical protein